MQTSNTRGKILNLSGHLSNTQNRPTKRDVSSPMNISIPKFTVKRPTSANEPRTTGNIIELIRKLNAHPKTNENEPKTMTSGEYRKFLETQSKNIEKCDTIPSRRTSVTRTTPPTKPDDRPTARQMTVVPFGKPPSGRKKEETKLDLQPRTPFGPKTISAVLSNKDILLTSNSYNESRHKGQIEDYRIDKQIGQGAYAIVRHALHIPTTKKVAFKTYEKIKLLDPNRKKNVMREIDILEMLDHPHIVKQYETIDTTRQLHIVMEYVSGCSLHGYLKRKPNRRLDEPEVKRIMKQILHAIDYCHNKNVTHRDLKLENLLLDDKNDVKIIDFGFSTCFPHEKKVKIFCGTPSYMAPEIVARKEYSGPPVDVWAIGILIFVLLCGHYPFKGIGDKELYKKIQQGGFLVPQHVSATAKSLLLKILRHDPNKRPKVSDIIQDP